MDPSLSPAVILVLYDFAGFGTAVPHALAAVSSCCLHSGTFVFLTASCESSTGFHYYLNPNIERNLSFTVSLV